MNLERGAWCWLQPTDPAPLFHPALRSSGLPAVTDGQVRETLPGLAPMPGARFPPPPPGGPGDGGLMTQEQLAELERRDRKAEKKAKKVRLAYRLCAMVVQEMVLSSVKGVIR